MDVAAILKIIEGGAEVFASAAGPQAQAYVAAGTMAIKAAQDLYTNIKGDLAPGDVATVDAALVAAHDKCGADLAQLLSDLGAD